MKGEQLRAFLWLRWRLRRNQVRRGGIANAVILAILTVLGALGAVVVLAGSFFLGWLVLGPATSRIVLYTWDGVVLTFLFFWLVGLLADLQRSEGVTLEKFLHLPVSLWGAFLLNYVSSMLNVSLVLFAPAMLGLSVGLAVGRGPRMLVLLPLVSAFLLMVTALTYQFQGWLAALMSNPRRRRTVVVIVTMLFVIVVQLPNAVNFLQTRSTRDRGVLEQGAQEVEAQRELEAGTIPLNEYQRRHREIEARWLEVAGRAQRTRARAEEVTRLLNLFLPPGWLPLGAGAAAEGAALPALFGFLGMTLIGSGSLWRAYQTTVRIYTGQTTAKALASVRPTKRSRSAGNMLEWSLPRLPERAAVVTLGAFRSLTRAPEAKMVILTPIIMVLVFGSTLFTRTWKLPDAARPLLPLGAMGTMLFAMVSLVGNQFAFDRSGFRVFVLCPASRRDILLGKNLATAPLALVLGLLLAVGIELVMPMRLDRFLAAVVQFVPMYLVFCLLANCLSILAPMPVTPGTMKPVNPKVIPVLLHVLFVLLMPLVVIPSLLPTGADLLANAFGWGQGWPIALALSLLEAAALVGLYLLVLPLQGTWLQSREKKILEVVTSKVT